MCLLFYLSIDRSRIPKNPEQPALVYLTGIHRKGPSEWRAASPSLKVVVEDSMPVIQVLRRPTKVERC